jgi:glycosyltransferase involved in cell wall biosynthesis
MEKEINNYDEIYFPHTELIKIYKKHDVYANLARIESFGITIIEALAAELPVVSFNTKGANEIIIDNQNGFLIEKYEPLDMANFLMKNFDKLSKHKDLNYDTIMHYDLKINTQLTIDIYKK